MGPLRVPWNTFWEPLSKMFSKPPPAQISYGSFRPWVCASPGLCGHILGGPILPVTCPCALPTAAQEKAPSCCHPRSPGSCESPSRGHCRRASRRNQLRVFLSDPTLCFGREGLTRVGLETQYCSFRLGAVVGVAPRSQLFSLPGAPPPLG